jgi:hypothetical protein
LIWERQGHAHPQLAQVIAIVDALGDSLIPHMRAEENILFPAPFGWPSRRATTKRDACSGSTSTSRATSSYALVDFADAAS